MTKGFWKDRARYEDTYFRTFPGVWCHGDWAVVDSERQWFLRGRSDDTLKIAGKRVGPAEIEGAVLESPLVAEAAAFGVPDALKGEHAVVLIVPKTNHETESTLLNEVKQRCLETLGKSLCPKEFYMVAALPKTRSGKIMRSLIRKAYCGEPLGDTSSAENPQLLESLKSLRSLKPKR